LRTFPEYISVETGAPSSQKEKDGASGEHTGRSKKRMIEAVQCFDILNAALSRIAETMGLVEGGIVCTPVEKRADELGARVRTANALVSFAKLEQLQSDPGVVMFC